MPYSVKEIFYTLQGEGAQSGRPAVFLRFAGCNLWSGREADRISAICSFCDTDFVGTNGVGGGHFQNAEELAAAVAAHWPSVDGLQSRRYVVCTGGEPLLQLDRELVDALHRIHFEVAVETNGTRLPPDGVDWICVSPKTGAPLLLRKGSELKFVFPQFGLDPSKFADLDFDYFYLQPMDGPDLKVNIKQAVSYCMTHPAWRLSLQTHKIIGLP
jgi:7-carboxy-7-deazaguanine synthase (Cx14CxxC type)